MPGSLLRGHPSIDRIITYRSADGLRGIRQLSRVLRDAGPFDITLNFNVYTKSIWPTLLSRAPRRIGFDRDRSFEGVWLASNERLPKRPWAHTADMFLEFAASMGVTVGNPEWRLRVTAEESAEQTRMNARFPGKPIATVIPASATHKKDWVTAGWIEVVNALSEEFGFQVVLAGGPGEREGKIAREIADRAAAPVELAMGDSVRRLMSIVGASNLVLAPDTGPVHIARAMNVPVIGIYGHTNPWRVGPWKAFQDLWVDHYTDETAGPDPSNRKPKWDVMQTISPAEVIDRISLAVTKYDVARPPV
jgi:heptosyltransferase I